MTSGPDMFPHMGLSHGTCRITCHPATMVPCVLTDMCCGDPMVPHQCLMRWYHVTVPLLSHDCGLYEWPAPVWHWPWVTSSGPGAVSGSPRAKCWLWRCPEVRGDPRSCGRRIIAGGQYHAEIKILRCYHYCRGKVSIAIQELEHNCRILNVFIIGIQ